MVGQGIRIPYQASRRQRKERRRSSGPPLYRISDFVRAYGLAILVNLACVVFAAPIILLLYPATGIVLSRYVGRRIVWFKYSADLLTVSETKLHFILTWPVSLLGLIWRLFVVKFL